MSLGQIEYEGISPRTYFKSDLVRRALEHIHLTFFVETTDDVLLEILKIAPINILVRNGTGVITGSVGQFRNILIEGLQKEQKNSVRSFLFEIYKVFFTLGLRELFSEYRPMSEFNTPYLQLEK